jgi:outer membrane protein TolC
MGFSSEAGTGPVRRGPNDLRASLTFELPFQRRVAAGKLAAAQAKLRQIQQREIFARDQVAAEVADAASAVRAAHERALLTTEEVTLARQLEEAERERFRLGGSTLFLVNLREQAAVDAAVREVAAHNEYFRALAQYELATAMRLSPSP